jgi:hypothetical protein
MHVYVCEEKEKREKKIVICVVCGLYTYIVYINKYQ